MKIVFFIVIDSDDVLSTICLIGPLIHFAKNCLDLPSIYSDHVPHAINYATDFS